MSTKSELSNLQGSISFNIITYFMMQLALKFIYFLKNIWQNIQKELRKK